MSFSNTISSFSNVSQVMDLPYFNWCENSIARLIWTVLAVIFYLLGFPASLTVFRELLQRQRVSNEIFMFNIAAIDLTFTAFIPLGLCNFTMWHILQIQSISTFVYSLMLMGRPLFMACICGECYIAVVHPILYKTSKKLYVIKKMITVAVWIITVLYASLVSNILWLIMTPFTSLPLMIALPIIAFCDISIFQALRKPDPSGKSDIHPQKKQALYAIFNSFIMTFIAYLPPAIIFLFGWLILGSEFFCSFFIYGVCFSMAGSVIMPILYLNSVGKLGIFKEWWKNSFLS